MATSWSHREGWGLLTWRCCRLAVALHLQSNNTEASISQGRNLGKQTVKNMETSKRKAENHINLQKPTVGTWQGAMPCVSPRQHDHPISPSPYLVAPGEPGLGEAMAQADSRAVPHLHEMQLHTRLWGQRTLSTRHPQSPLGAPEPRAFGHGVDGEHRAAQPLQHSMMPGDKSLPMSQCPQ